MIVDARGLSCPQPLIETKKAIDSLTELTTIEVLIDDATALGNVTDYLLQLGISATKTEGGLTFTTAPLDTSASVISCNVPNGGDYSVVVNRMTMGSGSDELGMMLMKAFFSTLAQGDDLPSHIIFYNEGVRYGTEDSALYDTLVELENRGVMLIICGTCVDYFGIKDQIAVGVISNMYKIAQVLQTTAKVVYP